MKKYLKKTLLFILSCLFVLSCCCLVACSDNSGKIAVYDASVECGKFVKVPEMTGEDVKVEVKSPSKKKVTITRDGFQLTEVGNYTINYKYGNKSKSITIKCTEDVSYPYLYKGIGVQTKGEFFVGTYYTADAYLLDPSGICTETTFDKNGNELPGSYDYRFYFEDETEPIERVEGSKRTFLIEKEGRYKVVLPAKDNLNNYHEYVFYFDAVIDYVDSDLVDENGNYISEVIADFDDEGYLDSLTTSIEWGDRTENFYIQNTADLGIVDGEPKDVLRAYPNESYSEHFVMTYEFFKPIPKDDVKYVFIKFYGKQRKTAEDNPNLPAYDYALQLYATPFSIPDSYLFEYLETGAFNCGAKDREWTIVKIPVDKLLYGSDTELKGIKFCVTGEICIEKIWISDYEFVDNDKLSNSIICDFDESDYFYQVTSYSRGDGANITHYTANDVKELGNKDQIDADNTNGGVIAISSKGASNKSAWVNISLGQDIVANKNTKIVFRVYYVPRLYGRIFSNLIFNRDGLTTHDGTENQYLQVIKNDDNASKYYERWTEFTLDSTIFAEENQTFNTIGLLVEGLVYIDQIEVR